MPPTMAGALQMQPPVGMTHLPASSLPFKFVAAERAKV